VDPAALGTVPGNVYLERFLPQSHVLPLAAAAIGHGGSGSTLAALAHGVPMVLLPMGADQFQVAARSASAGSAIVVRPHEANAVTVHRALHTVLGDESYRNAARAVQDEITAMPTPADTAAAVEQFVAGRR
jgi:UDP:flavonoid glycosyltransferase YjiC (YdhE family)